jgi:hypothetical protein
LWSGDIAPRILDLGTRRRWVVSFTARPLYLRGKRPWYPLDTRLGGLQSLSGRCREEKISQPPPGIEPPNIQPIANCYTDRATPDFCTIDLIANFEAFTAVKVQVEVFWVVTLCSVVVGYQHFRSWCCVHLHNPEGLNLQQFNWSLHHQNSIQVKCIDSHLWRVSTDMGPSCLLCEEVLCVIVPVCNQKFPGWPPGGRTTNGTALCH